MKELFSNKKSGVISAYLLPVLLILLTLLICSVSVLGSHLARLATGDAQKNVVKLVMQNHEASGGASSDGNGSWLTQTEVSFFDTVYKNADGDITVDGNGDKVIAPGTEGRYTFSLKNTGKARLDYRLELESLFGDRLYIPVEAVLYSDTRYVFGSAEEWLAAEEMLNYPEQGTLAVQESVCYTFEWRWQFESESGDWYDTLLGNGFLEGDSDFTLTIRTVASVSAGDLIYDVTGNVKAWVKALFAAGIAGILATAFAIFVLVASKNVTLEWLLGKVKELLGLIDGEFVSFTVEPATALALEIESVGIYGELLRLREYVLHEQQARLADGRRLLMREESVLNRLQLLVYRMKIIKRLRILDNPDNELAKSADGSFKTPDNAEEYRKKHAAVGVARVAYQKKDECLRNLMILVGERTEEDEQVAIARKMAACASLLARVEALNEEIILAKENEVFRK